jgi:tetraacyldisaccharide 4'-kinase
MGLEHAWYRHSRWLFLLRPLSTLYRTLAARRRRRLEARQWHAPVPVIIVGNITVGGSGKTPLTLALIEQLRRWGYRPGVVSRGYGARPPHLPFAVGADTDPVEGGDEPCLLVRRTGVPLYIDPDRTAAARALLETHDCDVLISDDGLQHYALGRDIELAVVDAARGLGNGRCLPEGPLREPAQRLREVDRVVLNGDGGFDWPGATRMRLRPGALVALASGQTLPASEWRGARRVHAVAGIGHPPRFFATLRALGFDPIEHPLPDHASLRPEMLEFEPRLPLLMTEKDAVKCVGWAPPDSWALRVEAELEPEFLDWLRAALIRLQSSDRGVRNGPETA